MSSVLKVNRGLEFVNYVAGTYAGMILEDIGAKVIKVENPEGGDPFQVQGNKKIRPIFEA